MTTDLDTLATALYVKIDDELKALPGLVPERPAVGISPTLSDAELLTLAVMRALPVLFALTGAKADERETLVGMLDAAADITVTRPGQTIIADKNYYGRVFEHELTEREMDLLRPAREGEPERAGGRLFKPSRQTIESINQTFKGQLDLERHGGRTPAGVIVRVLSRILALTAAIWLNDKTGQPVKRSLIAYDH